MRITVTVENPTPEAMADIDAFLTKHAAVVQTDTAWTPARARLYYDQLPDRAKAIVLEAVRRGGVVPADALRPVNGKSLRGHAGALKTTVTQGAATGLWPHGMEPPVSGIGPGYGKVQGYRIGDKDLRAFQEGLAHLLGGEA